MTHRTRLVAIVESDSVGDLYDLFVKLKYDDVCTDDNEIKNKILSEFNKELKFLISFYNDNANLIGMKDVYSLCPSGIELEFFLAFLEVYPFSDFDIRNMDDVNMIPTLLDSEGSISYLFTFAE